MRPLAGDAGGAGSEDCLKLNIYAPHGAKEGENRERNFTSLDVDSCHVVPVLFYIHGGGKLVGSLK